MRDYQRRLLAFASLWIVDTLLKMKHGRRARSLARAFHIWMSQGDSSQLLHFLDSRWDELSKAGPVTASERHDGTRIQIVLILPRGLRVSAFRKSLRVEGASVLGLQRVSLTSLLDQHLMYRVVKEALARGGCSGLEGIQRSRALRLVSARPWKLLATIRDVKTLVLQINEGGTSPIQMSSTKAGLSLDPDADILTRGLPVDLDPEGDTAIRVIGLWERPVKSIRGRFGLLRESFAVFLAEDEPSLLLRLQTIAYLPNLSAILAARSSSSQLRGVSEMMREPTFAREDSSPRISLIRPLLIENDTSSGDPLVSHGQFRGVRANTARSVEVWHGRFIVRDHDLLLTENAEDPRSEMVAGNHNFYIPNSIDSAKIPLLVPSSQPLKLETALMAAGRCDTNWFHFLLETLPKAITANEIADGQAPMLIRQDALPAAREALICILGRQPIGMRENSRVFVDKLFFGSLRSTAMDTPFMANLKGDFDTQTIDLVRERAWKHLSARSFEPKPTRLLLLRNSGYRRLKNLDPLRTAYERRGYRSIEMSSFSFFDQVGLMVGASEIVVQGGAAVANTVFCRPGTSVQILCSSEGGQPSYWSNFLKAAGLDGSIEIGITKGPKRGPQGIHSDFIIPISRIA